MHHLAVSTSVHTLIHIISQHLSQAALMNSNVQTILYEDENLRTPYNSVHTKSDGSEAKPQEQRQKYLH